MKKNKLFFCSLIFVMALSACSSSSKTSEETDSDFVYTPQDISERDVSYPTELPTDATEPMFAIHYHRDDNKYSEWGIWLWDEDGDTYEYNYQDDFGVTAYYAISTIGTCENGMGFIIRKLADWTKDYSNDRFIYFDLYEMDDYNTYHFYIYSNDGNIYSGPNKTFVDSITLAAFTDDETVHVTTTNKISYCTIYKDGIDYTYDRWSKGYYTKDFTVSLPDTADITSIYTVSVIFAESEKTLSSVVSVTALYKTDSFNSGYTYDGELGAIYSSTSTTFRVWSPVSTSISLRLYDNGTPTSVSSSKGSDTYDEYTMTKGDKGVFEVTVNGNLSAKYYTYVVTNGSYTNKEIVDPYAKSAGVNGLRGQVVNFDETNPSNWDSVSPIAYNRNELTVWETHVSDVTSHSSWTGTEEYRRKYLGMAESGTTYTKNDVTVKTGFDHIVELGVNAVQILPMFDQDNDEVNYEFNWGYNPLNYNVVEGLYSTDPYDGYTRIKELKTLIQAYNKEGINIIMDVVYNHVMSASGSNFDVLMPGYYFRYDETGALGNGSGCGNETASEMPMMHKFIIDSATFWAEEYKLGGFRFDLMGLHDLDTMNELTAACQEINPSICIYGEPWTGGTSVMENYNTVSARQANGNSYVGYGQFNDKMRDALIKGGLNSDESLGWVTDIDNISSSDVLAIQKGIMGSTYDSSYEIADPNKTVNYVTCHDNYTLYDRVSIAASYLVWHNDDTKLMCVLANAVVLTSQGTTFILGGEEMLRTKGRDSNSYNSGDDVNQYDYSRLITYSNIYENYKALINFKQTADGLHSSTCDLSVSSLDGGSILSYEIVCSDATYQVIHSNGIHSDGSDCTTSINLSGYTVYWDTLGTYEVGDSLSSSFTPEPFQTLIAKKN